MRKGLLVLCLLLCLTLLSGCAGQTASSAPTPTATAPAAAEKTTGVGFYFDTVVTVTLYGAPDGLMEQIWEACAHYEQLLSKTVEGSDVYRINQAQGQPVTVDAETWRILKRAKEISALTEQAFCVTIAPMTAMWDFTGGTKRMPTQEQRLAALPLLDDNRLILGENNTVTLDAGMQIDLGGIAKGYIADQVAAMVRPLVVGATLNFGGNVYAVGHKPDGSAFNLGLQKPGSISGTALAVVKATDVSMVTSGTYERYFELDGVTYHHILDPKTGLPADSDLCSVTIMSESSMDADALATACIVMGLEKARQLLEAQGLQAVFITRDGELSTTAGFEAVYSLRML